MAKITMNIEKLKKLVQEIVRQAKKLKDEHTKEKDAPVNYAAIFTQTLEDFDLFISLVKPMGKIVLDTSTGPLFQIAPLETSAGQLRLLKIRIPDATRPEQGDADFTVNNYSAFKKTYLSQAGFKLIEREKLEMIELIDPKFKVRAYFSNPPLTQQLDIK
jgi:hypothetical protein